MTPFVVVVVVVVIVIVLLWFFTVFNRLMTGFLLILDSMLCCLMPDLSVVYSFYFPPFHSK